jgi:hypothetical protein
MRSFSRAHACLVRAGTFLVVLCGALGAAGEPLARGFAVERYSPADPGGGWLVMDELNLAGRWGAGVSFATGYAHRAYVVPAPNGDKLDVVEHRAFVSVAMAVFYQRYRLSLNIANPVFASGHSGVVAGHQFTAPSVDPGKYPDKVGDIRVGLDALLFGETRGPLRLGMSAQAWVPSGEQAIYATDGTWRALLRALAGGDTEILTYAAYVGVHMRRLDESSIVGAPHGSEMIAGGAIGPRFALDGGGSTNAVLGPEVWGATAFRDAFGKYTSGLETMLGIRLQHTTRDGAHTVVKAGFGEGLHSQFGTPEWRAVFVVESNDRLE